MRKMLVTKLGGMLALVTVGAISAAFLAEAEEPKVKPGEAVVVFEDTSHAEQGPVKFNHLAHKEAFGEETPCKRCHITPKLFAMKRKPGEARQVTTMKEMEQGKSCGACHDGKTVINGKTAFSVASEEDCARCHKKD